MKGKTRVLVVAVGAWALMTLPPWTTRASRQIVGPEVYEVLRTRPWARVVIALTEPKAPVTDLRSLTAEVSDTRQAVLSGLDASDFRLTKAWPSINAMAGDVSASGLERLLVDPDVLKVDLDVPVYAALAESVPMIRANEVQDMGFTGSGVTVAVLDSGIDTDHADFTGRIVAEQCFCTSAAGAGCCPNGSTQQSGAGAAEDAFGHGTNVTGVVASAGRVSPRGVAPNAAIVALRVLDSQGGASSTTQILSGLDFLVTSRPEVKVVNMSLGTANLFAGTCDNAASFTMAFASSIARLKSRGTVVFASSLNNGSSSTIGAPACVAATVAVGAVYDGNVGSVSFGCQDPSTRADLVACFSNSSSAVDLLAPGAAITASGVGGGTSTFLGTSQACPHAAGAAALLLQARPTLTPDQIEAALRDTGVSVTDPKNGLSFRRIDVRAALTAAQAF